jgi:hypothetical protein
MDPIRAKLLRWRRDPIAFVREELHADPDAWQLEALEAARSKDRLALKACKGPGKAHPISMEFYTPRGLQRWGDLRVGDEVFAADGSVTRIAAIFDRGVLPMKRVYFNDGSAVDCCDEHLWQVKGRTERRQGRWAVLSTAEIQARGVRNRNGRWSGRQFEIPRQGAAEFPRQDVPLDPYVLGVWLGDGSKSGGRFSSRDNAVDDEIRRRGYRIGQKDAKGIDATIYGISGHLRALGLFGKGSHERRVPEQYRIGSIAQRLDLLRGLMDTDGAIGGDGHAEFAVTSSGLADDVIHVVRSLGGWAKRKAAVKRGWYPGPAGERIPGRLCYRVTVTMPVCPFLTPRKAQRWRPKVSPEQTRYLTRYIDRIESLPPAEARCIEVEHSSRLYLANDFIVTHNTTVLAWITLWFLSTRPHAKVGCTSITGDNLNSGLWSELAKWMQRSPYLTGAFTWTSTRVFCKAHRATWFAEARTWPKKANAEEQAHALAGFHADYCMFVLDESSEIPQAVMATAEAVLGSGIEVKVLQAGNPTRRDGPLYRACTTERMYWHVVTITGDPDSPNRSPRVRLEWARQQIASYGRENPWVMVNVLGEFPEQSIDALIGVEDVERAVGRSLKVEAYEWAQKRLGVDVARYGDDRTVIFPRQGLAAFRPKIMRHARGRAVSVDIANAVLGAIKVWGSEIEIMDATGGWAAGARDVLVANNRMPIEVQFHAPGLDPRYANRRIEMWWRMAEAIKGGMCLPNLPEIFDELTAPTYAFKGGKMILEPKELVKERIGRSPDLADALALTFALPDMPADVRSPIPGPRGQTRRGRVITQDQHEDEGRV